MSDKEQIERKENTERRVYNLPLDLLERLRAYQASQGIVSEIEAVRRLLHSALQRRDTVTDILNSLEMKFADEKDLRVLAAEMLSKHVLIEKIYFNKDSISFVMENQDRGMVNDIGKTYFAEPGFGDDDWTLYKRPKGVPGKPSWEPDKGGDLDDEIPF